MAQPARLTSELLARKGQALPTSGLAYARVDSRPPHPAAGTLDWQDCGTPPQRQVLLPALRHPINEARERKPRHEHASDDRIAFTVRLDRDRYTRLKILAVRRSRSGQDVLLTALDAYLEACAADCACLRKGGNGA